VETFYRIFWLLL